MVDRLRAAIYATIHHTTTRRLATSKNCVLPNGGGASPPPPPPPEGSSRLSIRAAAATQGVSTGVFQTADRARADFRSKF